MKRVLIGLLLALYPFLIYFGLDHFSLTHVSLVLIGFFILRLVLSRPTKNTTSFPHQGLILMSTTLAGCALVAFSWVSELEIGLRFYPVAVSSILCVVFAVSLKYPPTVIQFLAQLKDKNLPPEGIRYTRNVTKIWIAFFIINGSIALYTALNCSLKTWSLYNGFISYICMGLLFAGEYLYRCKVLKVRTSA